MSIQLGHGYKFVNGEPVLDIEIQKEQAQKQPSGMVSRTKYNNTVELYNSVVDRYKDLISNKFVIPTNVEYCEIVTKFNGLSKEVLLGANTAAIAEDKYDQLVAKYNALAKIIPRSKV